MGDPERIAELATEWHENCQVALGKNYRARVAPYIKVVRDIMVLTNESPLQVIIGAMQKAEADGQLVEKALLVSAAMEIVTEDALARNSTEEG